MSAIAARLSRLEDATGNKVHFRFLVIRGGKVTPEDQARVLATHGESVGPHDLVLIEQHGEDVDPSVAADEPLSLSVIESHTSIEDAIGQLDKEEAECA